MAKISVVNLKNEKVKDLTLNDEIWNIEVNRVVLTDAIKLALNSLRQGTAKTKTRGEVAFANKKQWRQKGTGRARSGSKRNPIWVGGGTIFGVTPRSYTTKMNKKERVLALKSALSSKLQEKSVIVVDDIKLENLKTSGLIKVLGNLKTGNKTLFVTLEENENLYMASRNLPNIGHIMANEINVLDLINANTVIFDEAAVKQIEEVLK